MDIAQHPVFLSLTPVFLLVSAGYLAGNRAWIRGAAVKDLSNLVFFLLIPALLFRTMSTVRFGELDLRPIAAYFMAVVGLFAVLVAWRGLTCRNVVMALAATFSNTVMIGITLVGLAYGQQGLLTLLTLVSVHALILLTLGSIVLEVAAARQTRASGGDTPHLMVTAWSAIKCSIINPVPLPILCGLAFAQLGGTLPGVIDRPLQLLGNAFGPLALVLVGVSLARTPMAGHWRAALWITASKNLVLPLLVGISGWLWGLQGLVLTVLVVAAGLPTGANVFLFAQRYQVVQELTTATMGVSTVLALFTLSAVMMLLSWLVPI